VDADVRDILTEPPGRALLGDIAKATPGGVREMITVRTDSPDYLKHIAGKSLSDEQLLDLLSTVPNLLRKPLLVQGTRALQGEDDAGRLRAFVEEKPEALR